MKKRLHVILLSGAMLLGLCSAALTACNNNNTPVEPEVTPNIASVTITGYTKGDTVVADGSTIALKASVVAKDASKDYSKKVVWTSSDESVATVKNGTVTFGKVSDAKEVTILAVSEEDSTVGDSVKFTVRHSAVDIYNSKPATLDTSMLFEDGTVEADAGDVAIVSADAYGTKFYFEAEISIEEFAETESYPKVGLMIAENGQGDWVGQGESIQSMFFYLDAIKSNMGAGVNTYNVVGPNAEVTNWEWGTRPGSMADFKAGNKVTYGTKFKMGILRNGTQYVLFTENAETGAMEAQKSFTWEGIDADKEAHVWVGGFNTKMTVGGFKAAKDAAADSYFEVPTAITVNGDQDIFVGESYQTSYSFDKAGYDASKVTFESSDPAIATVDENGKVTAGQTNGEATITIKYGELSASYKANVSNDPALKVVLDGVRDDALWETAGKKPLILVRDDGARNFERVYAIKTKKGVYVAGDLYTSEIHNDTEWWKGDNVEIRARADEGEEVGGQIWWSTIGHQNYGESAWTGWSTEKGLNKISFEAMLPYSAIGNNASINSKVEFGDVFGSNPGGNGWHSIAGWHEVTAEGFADGGHGCEADGHAYGAEYVVTPVTCLEDGESVKYCRWCDHEEEIVIKTEGKHTAKEDTIEEVTAATKEAPAHYKATCSICGNEFEYDGDRTANLLDEAVVNTHLGDNKGWTDSNNWAKILPNLKGDFKYEINFNNQGALQDDGTTHYSAWGDSCWRTVLPIVHNYDAEGNPGDRAVFRMDWWGWVDNVINDGETFLCTNDDAANMTRGGGYTSDCSFWFDYNAKLTFARSGSTVTLDYVLTSGENVAEYHQSLANVVAEEIGLSLSGECEVCTVNSIYKLF